jgi:hypothetical protein
MDGRLNFQNILPDFIVSKIVRYLVKTMKWLMILFIVPALAAMGWWAVQEHPGSWRNADWSSSGILPTAANESDAVIHILSARTGGIKGALSQHSWIVLKRADATSYDRYDKVGWGQPVRRNAYAADGKWYSNTPMILQTIRGRQAEAMIPKIEAAINAYPYSQRGGYTIWPGPNSNSFVAHVLRQVPELGIVLPPNAVGRDYLANGAFVHVWKDYSDIQFSLFGLAGVSVGKRSGLELNFLGLVTGLDVFHPALKLPGFGRIGLFGDGFL